jgi:hypothetical protein
MSNELQQIKMLNVKEDIEILINVNDNVISILDKDNKQIFFKIVPVKDKEQLNNIIKELINKHFDKGYVIMNMNLF